MGGKGVKLFIQIEPDNRISNVIEDDFKKFLKLKPGDRGTFETWKERNVNFHRKYFALLKHCIYHMPEDENFDRFRNIESLRREIMLQNGRFDIHTTLGNKIHYVIHSISFKSMDNEEFEKVYAEALNTILKRFLKNISQEDFESDLIGFC